MKCNSRKFAPALFSVLLLLCILSSCAHLPGKDISVPVGQTSALPEETGNSDLNAPVDQPVQIQKQETWTAPDPGATVTPIILMPEKRGEESTDMIIRSGSEINDEEAFVFDSNVDLIATATPVPAVIQSQMKDEMEVYSFAPVSGSVVLPNQALHMDVTLKNTGTTVWQTNYKIVDYSNMPMTVQREYTLPYAVSPQGTVLISIYMTSPSQLGSYPANFQIQDSYGNVFGQFDYILTVGGFSSITEIPTLTATVTPTYYSAEGITATPDTLAWMCIDPERSKLQDCYRFCVEYSHREEFKYCFYDGERYTTPIP